MEGLPAGLTADSALGLLFLLPGTHILSCDRLLPTQALRPVSCAQHGAIAARKWARPEYSH